MKMMGNMWAMCLVVLLCGGLWDVAVVEAAETVEVHRLFQLQEVGSGAFKGSQKAAVNHRAATAARQDGISQNIIVVPAAQLDIALLEDLVQRGAGAILVLIPSDDAVVTTEQITAWHHLEKKLMQMEIPMAVYVGKETEATREMLREISAASGEKSDLSLLESIIQGSDEHQLVISTLEPVPISNVVVHNFQGWLPASASLRMEGEKVPTLAVVAYYDTFAVAPGLAKGADSSASGVVALLELARIFSKLYNNPKTQGRYNLLFLLTGAGRINYVGAKNWLASSDARILDNIEFALCLDTIAGEDLYFHVSKVPKDSEKDKNLIQLFNGFNNTAKQMDLSLQINHKKISADDKANWEHEQFSRKRIPAATLSHLSQPTDLLSRSHIFDTSSRINHTLLQRNIKFIAEGLAKQIFGFQESDLEVFSGSWGINPHFVESWMETVTSEPRLISSLNSKSPTLQGMAQVLKNYCSEVVTQTFELDPESPYIFYNSLTLQMSIYRVKPFLFDVLIALAVSTYLLILYACLKGPAVTFVQLKSLIFGTSKSITKKKQ